MTPCVPGRRSETVSSLFVFRRGDGGTKILRSGSFALSLPRMLHIHPPCHETIHAASAARGRKLDGRRARGHPPERGVAVLLQIGKHQRQRPPRHTAPHLGHRPARRRIAARNHGKLPERHLHPGGMGLTPPLRPLLRRTDGRRPVRQRLTRRDALRRRHGLHVRDHGQGALRHRQRPAHGREQQLPQRRAAHVDGHEPLRRHLPPGGAHRHRPHGRLAPLFRKGCSCTPPS